MTPEYWTYWNKVKARLYFKNRVVLSKQQSLFNFWDTVPFFDPDNFTLVTEAELWTI